MEARILIANLSTDNLELKVVFRSYAVKPFNYVIAIIKHENHKTGP